MTVQPGYLFEKSFMGVTGFEQGLDRKAVWLKETHQQNTCTTRGGKAVTDQAFHLAFHPGSALVVTPKCDLIDMTLGRRTDITPFLNGDRGARGVNPVGITEARFHIPGGVCFNFAGGNQSVYPVSRHTLLSDVDITKPNAWGRLVAIMGASFVREKGSKTDKWFSDAPTSGMAAAGGALLYGAREPARVTPGDAYRFFMGVEPNGQSSPARQQKNFELMIRCPACDGRIAAAANGLLQLGEKAFGSLNSEVQVNAGWMIDPRFRETLSGPSEASYEELGGDLPMTFFVSPIEGDTSSEAFLRAHLRLMLRVVQERDWTPKQRLMLMLDELAQYAGSVDEVRQILPIGAARNLFCNYYWQSISQMIDCWGEHGFEDAIANSCLQIFGVNDPRAVVFIRERLGKTTIRRGGREVEVDLASSDRIERDLKMSSPIKYVFSRSRPPMRLERLGMCDLMIEGGRIQGMPGMDGHCDTLSRQILRERNAG